MNTIFNQIVSLMELENNDKTIFLIKIFDLFWLFNITINLLID